tara:strand:- start:1471 stop:1665 length:195 start_codon:yes stop_codon:yes gene_type:complete
MPKNDEYGLPEGGVEVLLLALQVFEKYGYKYPSIVKDKHYSIASKIQRDLLLLGVDEAKQDEEK